MPGVGRVDRVAIPSAGAGREVLAVCEPTEGIDTESATWYNKKVEENNTTTMKEAFMTETTETTTETNKCDYCKRTGNDVWMCGECYNYGLERCDDCCASSAHVESDDVSLAANEKLTKQNEILRQALTDILKKECGWVSEAKDLAADALKATKQD